MNRDNLIVELFIVIPSLMGDNEFKGLDKDSATPHHNAKRGAKL